MNNRVQLTNQNKITFKRVNTKACTHYEIYTRVAGSDDREYLLDKIENPKTPVRYHRERYLKYESKNKNKEWQLDEDAIARTSSDVIVYVNGVRLNTGQYTFSSPLRILTIHEKLKVSDSIKIEYFVDRIEYTHNTNRVHEYRVVPIFKKDYILGDHTYLRY